MRFRQAFRMMLLLFMVLTGFAAAAQGLLLEDLVRSALRENPDVLAAVYSEESEMLNYESAVAGGLPTLGFTSDTGNSPLYSYSDAEEFSMTTFTSGRVIRHRTGGGLNLGFNLPTGGTLNLSGIGSLDASLSEGNDDWEYLVSPALSGYLRQPLFRDRLSGAPLRFDSLQLSAELAGTTAEQAEISRITAENRLIISVASAAASLNSLRRTEELLQKRIDLSERKLALLLEDEAAGRSSNIDRLAQELSLRRQQEALIELEFSIESAEYNLRTLTGVESRGGGLIEIRIPSFADNSGSEQPLAVRSAAAARRSLELIASVSPTGEEPVLEISGSLRSAGGDAAEDPGAAFVDAASSEMNFSLSMALSFSLIDWGRASAERDADLKAIEAAEMRTASAARQSQQAIDAAGRRLELNRQKSEILGSGLEYDLSLLEREKLRYEAGLTSELAVKTVELDLLERRYNIEQLSDERTVARLNLLDIQGVELNRLYDEN